MMSSSQRLISLRTVNMASAYVTHEPSGAMSDTTARRGERGRLSLVLLGAFAHAGVSRLTAPGPITPSFLLLPLIGDKAATSTKILAEAVGIVAVVVLFLPSSSLTLT